MAKKFLTLLMASRAMGRTCLLAAIFASVRRTVSAFHLISASRSGDVAVTSSVMSPTRSLLLFRPAQKYSSASQINRWSREDSSRLSMSSTAASAENSVVLKRVKTKDAAPSDETVSIKGWVRTVRKQKTLAFVEVNDGSSLSGIQCVLLFDDIDVRSIAGK